MPPEVGVGVASLIFDDAGGLLMMQRAGAHGAGKWAPPGGWVDKGEWPADTAAREVREEVGLQVSVVDNLGWTRDIFPEGVEDVCFWFVCLILPGSDPEPHIMEADKCDALRWVKAEELREMLARGELFLAMENFVRDGGYARAARIAGRLRRGR